MSLGLGLDLLILLCALGVFVQSFRADPTDRGQLRLLSLGFVLMGVSDFLKPVSESLALGVDATGLLILLGVGIRAMMTQAPAMPKG